MKAILAMLLIALSMSPVAAQDNPGKGVGSAQARWIFGGLSSCDAWTKAHTTNAPERLTMEYWVAGYLSNFNTITDDPDDVPDFLKEEDWDALVVWIDNYCVAHPLDKLDKAARELELELLVHH
jgi:hypothetical protein